jgi:hypothetical protein
MLNNVIQNESQKFYEEQTKEKENSNKNKINSVAFSLQANYTNWATATCRRNLVPTFAGRGVSRGQRGGSPTVVNLSRYFFFQVAPHLSSQGLSEPVPDPLLLRKFGSARNWTQDLWDNSQELWPLEHRHNNVVLKTCGDSSDWEWSFLNDA